MQHTGIVRRVDALGRIVLPIELRKSLEIAEGDPLEILVDRNTVVLRKYEPQCTFCGEAENVKPFKTRNVCARCVAEMSKSEQIVNNSYDLVSV